MCYSAQIWAEYRKFERAFGAGLGISRYVKLFWDKKKDGGWQKIPKAVKAAFANPRNDEEREIAQLIADTDKEQAQVFEAELFQQKTRLKVAERALAVKPTKKALDDQRIATDKIARAQRNLADLRRTELLPRDSRILPGQYAPVMLVQDGKRVVVPMRYQCRLPVGRKSFNASIPTRTTRVATSWRKHGPSCSASSTASWS